MFPSPQRLVDPFYLRHSELGLVLPEHKVLRAAELGLPRQAFSRIFHEEQQRRQMKTPQEQIPSSCADVRGSSDDEQKRRTPDGAPSPELGMKISIPYTTHS